MSDQQDNTETEAEAPKQQPGEIIRRLQSGVDLGRLRGAGYGTPTPAGATVDVTTGEVTQPEKPAEEKPKEEEPKPEPEAPAQKDELLAVLDRIETYVGRLRRQVPG